MEHSNDQLVNEFESFISFIQSIKDISLNYWHMPLGEGKFSIHDTLSHIMMWDKYFYEEAINKIKLNQSITSQHLNFDDFNRRAVDYGKILDKNELIEMTINYRNQIIEYIKLVPKTDYSKEFIDGDGKTFTIREYLQGFIPHDKHHQNQVETFIKTQVK
jgi:uncharacterized damage-inducible protein DinB